MACQFILIICGFLIKLDVDKFNFFFLNRTLKFHLLFNAIEANEFQEIFATSEVYLFIINKFKALVIFIYNHVKFDSTKMN